MRRAGVAGIAILCLAVGFAAGYGSAYLSLIQPKLGMDGEVGTPPESAVTLRLAAPETPSAEEVAKTEDEKKGSEQVIAEPVAYFPPPTTDLTGGKLGTQRVPGTEGIGDVYQLHFDDASQALFMAVIEPDGLRSIWRLKENGAVDRVFAVNAVPGEIRILGDGQGVMYVEHDNPSRVYRTADGFKTWFTVLEDKGIFWQIAHGRGKTVYGTLHSFNEAVLYRSSDDGYSWERWIDFQEEFPEYAVRYDPADTRYELRHLHGVIYNDSSDAILVGTGDVTRFTLESRDDGGTWEKVWDEGFTASTVMSGGNRYLLCPDKLRGPGIALYDLWAPSLKEVWNPKPYDYAGFCYSMLNVDGIYYAAFHTEANEVEEVVPRSGVIVSPDGLAWYPFLEWDPLSRNARTNIWLAAAPARIYASLNGSLYAFAPLKQEWFTTRLPFKK